MKIVDRAIIQIDWNDLKSIKRAEKRKERLENKGYILNQSLSTNNSLTYELKK